MDPAERGRNRSRRRGMANLRTAAAAAAVLTALCGCRTWGGAETESLPEPVHVAVGGEDAYVHGPSGLSFPPTLAGEFLRERVTRFDVEGRDVGVGYNLLRPPRVMAATVFVLPSPRAASLGGDADAVASMKANLAEDQYRASRSEVLLRHGHARLVSEGEFDLPGPGGTWRGRHAAFTYRAPFAGAVRPLDSHLYQFAYVDDRWTVKVRISHPEGSDAAADIERFLRGIREEIHRR